MVRGESDPRPIGAVAGAPHDAVILAIDPGATSGWAVVARGRVFASGVARTAADRAGVVGDWSASLLGLPDVAVVETWTVGGGRGRAGGTRWTPSTMIGLGAARGRWLERLELACVPARRIVSVTPATWRAVLAGLPRKTTDDAKRSAAIVARAKVGRPVEPDEAEAICIGLWAAHAPEVGAVLPRRS